MKFLHAADLHLDSPLRGLSRYEGAPVEAIRGATRRALDNLVNLCIDEAVDFLLIAGDLYDGDWRDYSTGLFFTSRMAQLQEAGVPVYLIRGNHDAASRITKSLSLPDNVTELATRRPQTVRDESLGIAVHGQGFASRAVTVDLAADYPDAVSDLFNIGLLHTCLDGRAGHDPYAPTSVEVLAGKGYDYWALGHVHAREVISSDPWIVFPGNLQGRHARETGAKGATLVTVDGQRVTGAVHCALDVVRWCVVDVDAASCRDGDEVVEAAASALAACVDAEPDRLIAARVRIVGESAAHRELWADVERFESEIRAAAFALGAEAAWVEKVALETRAPIDLAALRQRDDPVGRLARALAELRDDDRALLGLGEQLTELGNKLPREAREGFDGVRLDDCELLRRAVAEVEQMLLPRLLSTEES